MIGTFTVKRKDTGMFYFNSKSFQKISFMRVLWEIAIR